VPASEGASNTVRGAQGLSWVLAHFGIATAATATAVVAAIIPAGIALPARRESNRPYHSAATNISRRLASAMPTLTNTGSIESTSA
jgi:hypothetical protein